MNIYEKLMAARLEFHQSEIKKSGWNTFSQYGYFELSDFVLPILKLFDKFKLFAQVSFTKELAMLTVIDMEKPEHRIEFTSPMGGAQLKGTHEIQQIGAVETYQRRYLYVMAMDIVEHDAIDGSDNRDAGEPTVTFEEAINGAQTLQGLQACFAEAYQATTGDRKKNIKALYDKRKADFVQKAD